jgi:type III pantothenate kinase
MLLLIDAGNTRVKWAVVDAGGCGADKLENKPGNWLASGAVDSSEVLELGQAWQGMEITHVILSNVAGEILRERLQLALSKIVGQAPVPFEWFASVPVLCGVRNGYRNPAQLGCDRFASTIGAHALFAGQPLIVATCGTATTIDAITADGVFMGGMILPGVALMAAALARNTAQLPMVEERTGSSQPFADNTDDAIVSGCIEAQVGAIERAYSAHHASNAAQGATRCVLSGGGADLIASRLSIPFVKVDNLVLVGLQVVASANCRK